MRFLLLCLEESAAEHTHRLGAVFVLAFLVLALHNGVCWEVGDPNGTGGLVDLLAAWATGEEGVDSKIVLADFDFDIVGLGKHRDSGGGSVDASLGFCFRDSLDAVAATLELELKEGTVSGDRDRDVLEATKLCG